jgi:lipoprotein-anchoring transpeptidase ErfK/SrfK
LFNVHAIAPQLCRQLGAKSLGQTLIVLNPAQDPTAARRLHQVPAPQYDTHAAGLPTPDELDFMQPARFSSNAGFPMLLFRFSFSIPIILLASLAVPVSPAFAQRVDMSIGDEPGVIPNAADEQLPPQFQRQVVLYRSNEAPGTIIVQTAERFLYVVQPGGRALRYGIGVGREGFQWQGLLQITRKQEWPDWTPPPEMIERQPYLPRFMAGGPGNPMGARALYLGTTVYRIHGTNQPKTIGSAVSSGCFRLVNGDVIDLYDRIPVGTKVIVRQKPEL